METLRHMVASLCQQPVGHLTMSIRTEAVPRMLPLLNLSLAIEEKTIGAC
jgi:hypothetical protein